MEPKPRLLVVDDDEQFCANLQDILGESGYTVETATGGKDAIVLCKKNTYDLALVDIKLPDIPGPELVDKVAKISPSTEIIYMTGYATLESTAEAVRQMNVVSYETKPLDMDRLLHTLDQILKRRGAEEALRASEEMYKTIVETIPDAVTVTDLEGRITYVSQQTLKLHGSERAEMLLGKSAFEFIALGDHERAIKDLQRTLKEGIVRDVKYNLMRKDGTYYPGELSAALIKDAVGKPTAFVVIIRDITERVRLEAERQRAEQARWESEEKYRNVVENAGEGIVVGQGDYFVFVNPAIVDISGYTPEELTTKPFIEFFHPEDRDQILLTYQKVLKGAKNIRFPRFRMIDKGRNTKWLELNPVLINWQGNPALLSFISDITEHLLLEELFFQAQKMEAVGRLAGGVAHDFNNVLMVITGFSDVMLSRLEENDPLRKNVNTIKDAANRAASLTHQLLAFSRKQMLQSKVLELNALITNTEKMLRPLIGEDIEFVTNLGPELGQIKADPGQIEQIIMNLAVNSRDAMPSGGRLVIETENVELEEDDIHMHPEVEPGQYVRMTISDTGKGMDEQTMSHIFEPFYTTKEKGEGTGLGLSTVYGIVKQNDGYIYVYSEPGKGTNFKIYFPRIGEVPAEKQREEAEESYQGTETILMVEDADEVRSLIQMVLQDQGYTVLEAKQGEDAVKICKKHNGPIDLLVTDMVLPGMNGREVAQHVKALFPDIKVLYISGYTEDFTVLNGMMEEATSLLQKPFSADVLLRRIREILGAKEQGK